MFPPTAIASTAEALLFASGSAVHFFPSSAEASSSSSLAKDNVGLIRAVALSDDSSLAVSAGDDKSLHLYDVVDGHLKLRNTRITAKRVASLSFAPGGILVTDKVGDVYLYPLDARDVSERPQGFKMAADPSLNPDADFLLGHVSVVSQHVLTPDAKYIITADRDEHIRVSRYPKSYVIEKYLWGSEGFVSAIHIPPSRPSLLVSGGGEATMQVFDWTSGELLRRVEVVSSILPNRCVRAAARKRSRKNKKGDETPRTPSDDPASEDWYVAPEGHVLPAGQGVVISKIDSVDVDGKTVVVFFAEGCTAVHWFVLDEDKPKVKTLQLPHPVLGFTQRPGKSSQLVVTMDPARAPYGTTEANSTAFALVDVAADAQLSDVSASDDAFVAPLEAALATRPATPETLAKLQLYPDLALYPRWPGFEEDEELAGPATADPTAVPDDAASMNSRQLGRMKAGGAEVQHLLGPRKKRKGKHGEEKPVEGEAVAAAETEAQVSASS